MNAYDIRGICQINKLVLLLLCSYKLYGIFEGNVCFDSLPVRVLYFAAPSRKCCILCTRVLHWLLCVELSTLMSRSIRIHVCI